MVGDGVVAVAAAPRGGQHLFQGGHAVGEVGVGVQVAFEVFLLHEFGQRLVELAAVFAQSGRDPWQPKLFVDRLLGVGGEQLVAVDTV